MRSQVAEVGVLMKYTSVFLAEKANISYLFWQAIIIGTY